MLNVCLLCSSLLIVEVIFVITVFFLFLLCVSTILVNKDDHNFRSKALTYEVHFWSEGTCWRYGEVHI